VTNALLIATRNQGKVTELRQLLSGSPLRLRSLHEFQVGTIDETGATFESNAVLKASGYALQTGMLTLADDSGLEVAALGGEPGVRSARYAGDQATDTQRIQKLLAELGATNDPDRAARFVASIAIADHDGKILHQSCGICEGRIGVEPRGNKGFGYDPIFIPDGYTLSFGELDATEKNKISHRARALAQVRDYLASLFGSSEDIPDTSR